MSDQIELNLITLNTLPAGIYSINGDDPESPILSAIATLCMSLVDTLRLGWQDFDYSTNVTIKIVCQKLVVLLSSEMRKVETSKEDKLVREIERKCNDLAKATSNICKIPARKRSAAMAGLEEMKAGMEVSWKNLKTYQEERKT